METTEKLTVADYCNKPFHELVSHPDYDVKVFVRISEVYSMDAREFATRFPGVGR